uniref:Uncharacterized protein n=1 Tax=Leptobrachium leishanense TaxID=445787 RepID=A0A8C5Q0M1_9ANUR
ILIGWVWNFLPGWCNLSVSSTAPTLPGFTLDASRCLLASVDTAALGSAGWEQFSDLWETISAGTRIFCHLPRQEVGALRKEQILPALQAAGLPVDDFVLQLSGLRYAEQDGSISYPNFICCLLTLQRVTGMFQAADPSGSGTVTLNYRQCMRLAMYS